MARAVRSGGAALPTSTKNREQERDPEMHQTKKGKQWYFGMKAHVGVDSKTKIIHTAVATAANVADSRVAYLSDFLTYARPPQGNCCKQTIALKSPQCFGHLLIASYSFCGFELSGTRNNRSKVVG